MQRKYPNIRGKVDAIVENEIKSAFDSLYDTIEFLAKQANVSLDANTKQTPSTIQKSVASNSNSSSAVGLDKGVFGQAQVGTASDPNLKPNVPDNFLRSEMKLVAGVVVVGGKVSIQDGFGHVFNFLVE
jgi:hypothetical protein